MRPISEYITQYQQLGHERFLREQNDAVLVHHADTPEGAGDKAFKTTIMDAASIQRLLQKPSAGERVVYPLTKRPHGQFPDRVSVGRTRASDVRLDYTLISKYHAYFAVNPANGQMTLTDANATNGTFVNGKRLQPNTPEVVADGSVIMFGNHGFTFYTGLGFAAYLRRGA